VDIIRTAYYILGLELMKLIFTVLDVSLTMGLTRCYKTEGFLHLLFVHCEPKTALFYFCNNFVKSLYIGVIISVHIP